MNKLKDFFSGKGFYVALFLGVFAFAILMIANDYREKDGKNAKEQAIDLNQPAENVAEIEDEVTEKEMEEIASNTEAEVEITNSNSAEAEVEEEQTTTEEIVETGSDGAEADVNQDTVTTPELVFDEESSLVWPVIGNVILPYSMDTTVYFQTLDVYKCNPGILIEASEGTVVASVCQGVVTEIAETKEYGTVMKVDLGSGYEATYGQIQNVTVSEGETIGESQIVAEVAPVSSYYAKEGNHLYFSMTKDGVPVDPMTLIQ